MANEIGGKNNNQPPIAPNFDWNQNECFDLVCFSSNLRFTFIGTNCGNASRWMKSFDLAMRIKENEEHDNRRRQQQQQH